MHKIDQYINQQVKNKEIPAAVLMISKHGKIIFSNAYGRYKDNDERSITCKPSTIFDLASLTKVMATLPAILLLQQEKELHITNKVQHFIPEFKHRDITIEQLLQHTSGLHGDSLNKDRVISDDIITEILNRDLHSKPGEKVEYSDLGMILLGKIIENVAGESLEAFCQNYLYKPWGLTSTQFLPSSEKLDQIATTERYQEKFIHGEVHDEKAYQLGGVSGSAGLFSTASDVSAYINYWLYPEKQNVLLPESMNLVFQNVIDNRGLGFEVWQGKGSELSCSSLWNKGSFGHTGFTGTSVWADPTENLSVVFLTNIVHYGRKHQLQTIRKQLHAMVYEHLVNK